MVLHVLVAKKSFNYLEAFCMCLLCCECIIDKYTIPFVSLAYLPS